MKCQTIELFALSTIANVVDVNGLGTFQSQASSRWISQQFRSRCHVLDHAGQCEDFAISTHGAADVTVTDHQFRTTVVSEEVVVFAANSFGIGCNDGVVRKCATAVEVIAQLRERTSNLGTDQIDAKVL